MRFDDKDWFHWVNLFTIIIFFCLYILSIPTLQRWSWGYWSYEYFAFCISSFVYFVWFWFVSSNRKLWSIESKIDKLLERKEHE